MYIRAAFQYIYCIYIYMKTENMELTKNGNFCLFVANEKQKRQTSICLAVNRNIKQKYDFSLVGKR